MVKFVDVPAEMAVQAPHVHVAAEALHGVPHGNRLAQRIVEGGTVEEPREQIVEKNDCCDPRDPDGPEELKPPRVLSIAPA